jgi:hypothetical protein
MTSSAKKEVIVNNNDQLKDKPDVDNEKFNLWAMRDILFLAICWAFTLTTSVTIIGSNL